MVSAHVFFAASIVVEDKGRVCMVEIARTSSWVRVISSLRRGSALARTGAVTANRCIQCPILKFGGPSGTSLPRMVRFSRDEKTRRLTLSLSGDTAENLDCLNSESEVPAVLDGTAEAQRDLVPRFVIPADVGVDGRDELFDRRG